MTMPPCPNCGEPHGLSLMQRSFIGDPLKRHCGQCNAELGKRIWEAMIFILPAMIVAPRFVPDDMALGQSALLIVAIILCWAVIVFTLSAQFIPQRVKPRW